MSKSKPFVEYTEKRKHGTKLRDPSAEELAAAEQLKSDILAAREAVTLANNRLRSLLGSCKHVVSQDTAGFPYDVRNCYACGHNQGLI